MATGKVNGKNKGNTFERKIANELRNDLKDIWYFHKGFVENADSGSYFRGANGKNSNNTI